jgi:hypothetical protein
LGRFFGSIDVIGSPLRQNVVTTWMALTQFIRQDQ